MSSLSATKAPVDFTQFNFEMLPKGFLSFEEFNRKFNLASTSTEMLSPITYGLSQTMQRNVAEGLQMLFEVDQKVVDGFVEFSPMMQSEAPKIAANLSQGGRVFLVGSGSSGRAAIDIAAKCGISFPNADGRVIGVIAGGDSAFIRPKEGFEDSEKDGWEALSDFNVCPQDCVILISASGSAPFNVGCGEFALDRGVTVHYFYNSEKIPERTEKLFQRETNPAIPLKIDTGPQAIAGSTRLQAASLAVICLGEMLRSALAWIFHK